MRCTTTNDLAPVVQLGRPRIEHKQCPQACVAPKAQGMLLFLTFGFCVFGLLNKAWDIAFKPFRSRPARSADDDGAESDPDLMDFGKVFSMRAQKAERFLSDRGTQMLVLMHALVAEPVKWLTSKFMACARRAPRPCRHPMLLDLTNSSRSPVVTLLQYFSALLSGAHPKVVLVVGASGFRCYAEFVRSECEQAQWWQRLLLAACGGALSAIPCEARAPTLLEVGLHRRRPALSTRALASGG